MQVKIFTDNNDELAFEQEINEWLEHHLRVNIRFIKQSTAFDQETGGVKTVTSLWFEEG